MSSIKIQWSSSESALSLPVATDNEDDETVSRIEAMQRQEDGPYLCKNYLEKIGRKLESQRRKRKQSNFDASACYVDADCRTKMSTWCYHVVDHCNGSREAVAIAMSFLDRYLCTNHGRAALRDRKLFQLAAITALYVSLKLSDDVKITLTVMIGLSRGVYNESEFTAMEKEMLAATKWHVHPPTAVSFIAHFLSLFPPGFIGSRHWVDIFDNAKYQAELAVNDPQFVGTKASTIAFASILNSVELVAPSEMDENFATFLHRTESLSSLFINSTSVFEARERLYELSNGLLEDCTYQHLSSRSPQKLHDLRQKESCFELSPRCASFSLY